MAGTCHKYKIISYRRNLSTTFVLWKNVRTLGIVPGDVITLVLLYQSTLHFPQTLSNMCVSRHYYSTFHLRLLFRLCVSAVSNKRHTHPYIYMQVHSNMCFIRGLTENDDRMHFVANATKLFYIQSRCRSTSIDRNHMPTSWNPLPSV